MPPPLPITFAQARLQDWKVWAFCHHCRMSKLMRIEDMVVSPHDETPFQVLVRERKFACKTCRGHRVRIEVKRDRVGVTELVARFDQG